MFRHVVMFSWAEGVTEAHEQEYRDHPAHRAVVEQYITPFVTDRAAVQYGY